jgi:hypothetical protein
MLLERFGGNDKKNNSSPILLRIAWLDAMTYDSSIIVWQFGRIVVV